MLTRILKLRHKTIRALGIPQENSHSRLRITCRCSERNFFTFTYNKVASSGADSWLDTRVEPMGLEARFLVFPIDDARKLKRASFLAKA